MPMAVIKCDSTNTLRREVDSLRTVLSLIETEDSWDSIANAITQLNHLCRNGACDFPAELVVSIRTFSRPLNSAMCSERSRLSGAAINLLCTLASGLGTELEPLLPLFFPALLNLCTRTNKVLITRARACILAHIENTQLPAILPYLSEASKDKSISLRITVAEGVLACLNCFNPPDLEKEVRARLIEDVIRTTARDASADVRKVSRKVFEAYKVLLPGRVEKFIAPLTPVMKKYLDIKAKHSASTNSNQPPSYMRSASSSVLPVAGQTKSDMIADPRPTGGAMPPPNYIPVRRGPPVGPPITASRSASSVEDKKRTTSAMSTLSGGGDSSRPTSTTSVAPPKATENPLCLPPPTLSPVVACRVVHPTTTAVPAATSGVANRRRPDATASDGPIRPLAAPSRAMASRPPVNPEAGEYVRVKGGARRVPLPPVTMKNKTSNVHSTSESVKACQPTVLSCSTKPDLSEPRTNKADQKLKPVPRAVINQSSTAKILSKSSHSDVEEARMPCARAAGVTHLTLTQHSRAKTTTVDRKGKNSAKPGWGRPAPPKAAVTKGLSIRGKTEDMKSTSRPVAKGKIAARAIPLPPNPKREKTPISVPLPLSPSEEDEKVRMALTEVEGGPTTATDETPIDKNVEESTSTLSLAVPLIPDPQEPDNSTPIPFQKTSFATQAGTPISTLLTSIQQGFMFTPCSPLSPPQSYLPFRADVDSEIDPHPLTLIHPSEHIQQVGYVTHDYLTTQPSDDQGIRISELVSVPEAKTPTAREDKERGVLSNVEVNH